MTRLNTMKEKHYFLKPMTAVLPCDIPNFNIKP